jgi:hypothetical protein
MNTPTLPLKCVRSISCVSQADAHLARVGSIETYDSDSSEDVKDKDTDSQPTKGASKKAKKGGLITGVKLNSRGGHSELLGEVWHGVLQKMPTQRLTVKTARLVYTAAMRQRWGT